MVKDATPSDRPTRAVAREAVRTELSRSAVELVLARGYENVTVPDLAQAAGVSKSTFLRYLGSKDSAVLNTFRAEGDRIVEALRDRPAGEDMWSALRHAIEPLLEQHRDHPSRAMALGRLVLETPSLHVGNLERQRELRDVLAGAIVARDRGCSSVRAEALAHAAIGCFYIAIEHWVRADGRQSLETLLDEAFDSLNPGTPRR